MISERAIPARRGAIQRRERTWRFPQLSAAPARAGRERLADALGKSVLVQLMLAMTFIATATLLYMAQESSISVQQINISALRATQIQLTAENTTLRSQATQLQTPQRVDTVANTQLGMSSPDPSSRMWVNVPVSALPGLQPVDADTVAAQQRSAPLAWMGRFVRSVLSSL